MRQERFKMERQGLVEECAAGGSNREKSEYEPVYLCSGTGSCNVRNLQEHPSVFMKNRA